MPTPEPNLFTHQIATLIQDIALPQFQGQEGFLKIIEILDYKLKAVGSDVTRATLSDYRRLYHDGWTDVVKAVSPEVYQDLLSERYRGLVF